MLSTPMVSLDSRAAWEAKRRGNQVQPTFVFWMIRCLGDRMRATREVEKSISIMETLPSSLLKILEKGSVW
jgi:hypothetical protein